MDDIGKYPFFKIPNYISSNQLKKCKIGFFIDTSQAANVPLIKKNGKYITYGDAEIKFMRKILKFIKLTKNYLRLHYVFINSEVTILKDYTFEKLPYKPYGELSLAGIFNNGRSFNIMTDEIDVAIVIVTNFIEKNDDVKKFGQYISGKAKKLRSIIVVIVGKEDKPSKVRIDVINSFIFCDSCILYYDIKNIYIMWSHGYFRKLWKPIDINNNPLWDHMIRISYHDFVNIRIPFYDSFLIDNLVAYEYVSFGHGLFFNPGILLEFQPKFENLMNYPFNLVRKYFFVNNDYHQFLMWFLIQKYIFDLNGKGKLKDLEEELTCFFDKMENLIKNDLLELGMISLNISKTKNIYKLVRVIDKYGPMDLIKWYYYFENYCFGDLVESLEVQKITCSICLNKGFPFVLIRKRVDEEILKVTKNVYSYFYKYLVCFRCAEKSLFKGVDPVRSKIIEILPLIILHPCLEHLFVQHFFQIVNIDGRNSYDNKIIIMINFIKLLEKYIEISQYEEVFKIRNFLNNLISILRNFD